MAVREFRAIWVAHALSMSGGYLLSIAVSALVYDRTGSALATGLTMALTFLPQIVGGPLLSGLADLFPRRRVIVVSEVARGLLVASIGIPGLPIPVIWVLLFCSILPTVPFSAARAALMTDIVQGERYVAGSAIINITSQVGTLIGLVAGGALVALLDPHATVLIDGLAFLLSALVIAVGVRARPAPITEGGGARRPSLWTLTREGTLLVFRDSRLRSLALFGWLAGFYMVPYGLANPLASEVGGGAAAAGLIMAGPSIGAVLGGLVLTRLVSPGPRVRLVGLLAVAASLPLLAWVLHPPLWAMVALLALSGMCSSYQFVANAAFMLCVPSDGRGLAFGLVAAGLQAAQGTGIVLASLAAEFVDKYAVVTVAGALGAVAAVALAVPWSRLAPETLRGMEGAGSAAG
ncbi:MFS transporter [Marinitenerispora sediminis]|uniref:MFS transporter n=2 Tax=Marinitenerispora sediminis TaxID=1931232 RepID=A0A368SZK1_9ACTN|nr:MFS transporter [Marinitenerispora sediminis]RCV51377.1 MFS transporter [Marinitenerispora sediminis]RCV56004.1 MFS transporter [Marinitenerispora sediminis]